MRYSLLLLSFFIISAFTLSAQVPAHYYNNAQQLSGTMLLQALHNIIDGHSVQSYSSVFSHFQQTDNKGNNRVWDIYSDHPVNGPGYVYYYGNDECGNYNSEGDCFNREHSWPASHFNNLTPMYTDLFQLFPTDGYVNGRRSNLPYGMVSNPSWTGTNGSKVGPNSAANAPSGNAFEPIDEFKGDLARTYFYIATRYYTEDNGWNNWEMANNAELKPWAVELLLQWHHQDPVSLKEIVRNEAIYQIQQNRNPFVDSPNFVDCIWAGVNCTTTYIDEVGYEVVIKLFPNPAHESVTINSSTSQPTTYILKDVLGKTYWHINDDDGLMSLSLENLPEGMYYIFWQQKNDQGVLKLQKQ